MSNLLKKLYFIAHDIPRIAILIFMKLIISPKKNFWLISERGFEAKDNGYFLFQWIVKNHPEIQIRYVIDSNSKDLHKFENCSDQVIVRDSINHYYYLCKSSVLISTHICGYKPDIILFYEIDKYINLLGDRKRVFLQHGIIKNDLEILYSKNQRLNLFVCGSYEEFKYVKESFGYKNGIVQYLGLCRYDNLYKVKTKKQILIMPTWRKYISKNDFNQSEYYIKFNELLHNHCFNKILKDNDLECVFYLHYEFQKFREFFIDHNQKRIKIADMKFDVQNLLKESKIVITDYSSILFDAFYMKKPIIFYQFDKLKFHDKHYKKGYFQYENVGDVCENETEVIDSLKCYIENNYILHEKHKVYYKDMFKYRDTNNCKRNFESIQEL